MTQWSAFVGLTGAVITAFLVLARLSQRVVESDDAAVATDDRARPDTLSPSDALDRSSERPDRDGRTEFPGRDEQLESSARDDRPESPVRDEQAESPDRPDDSAPSRTGERADPERWAARSPDFPGHWQSTGDNRGDATAGTSEGTVAAGEADDGTAADGRGSAPGAYGGPSPDVTPGMLLANVALTQGLFGVLLAAGAWYFQIPAWALGIGGGSVTGLRAIGVGVAFGAALWVGNELASGVADVVGADYDEGLRQTLSPQGPRGWVLLLGITLPIIALVEEFIFRAAAIGAPAVGLEASPWALAVVSSVAFALGHGAQGRVGVAVTGLLGFVLAGGFVVTGSFVVVVVAHYLVNALEFLVHEWAGLPDPVWD